jgi:hypothetical protein
MPSKHLKLSCSDLFLTLGGLIADGTAKNLQKNLSPEIAPIKIQSSKTRKFPRHPERRCNMALNEWLNGDPTYLECAWKISTDNILFVNIVNQDNLSVRQQKPLGVLVSTRYSKKPAIFSAGQECSASFLVGVDSSAHQHPYVYILQEKNWYPGSSNPHFTSHGQDFWQQYTKPHGKKADKGMWLKAYLKKAAGVEGDDLTTRGFATTQFSSRANSPSSPVNRSTSSGSSNSKPTLPNFASGVERRTSTEKQKAGSPTLVGTSSPNQQPLGTKLFFLFPFCIS